MQRSSMFATVAATLIVAGAAGFALGQAARPDVEPEARVEQVEVPMTPDVCGDALAEADRIILMAGGMGDHVATYSALMLEAMEAAAVSDWRTFEELAPQIVNAQQEMDDATASLVGSRYGQWRDECLEGVA